MFPDTRAESGVTSPDTKASSVDSNRAAPVQRSQCPAVYQMSQAAKTRKRIRKIGKSQPPSQPEREAAVRGEALSVGWVSVMRLFRRPHRSGKCKRIMIAPLKQSHTFVHPAAVMPATPA